MKRHLIKHLVTILNASGIGISSENRIRQQFTKTMILFSMACCLVTEVFYGIDKINTGTRQEIVLVVCFILINFITTSGFISFQLKLKDLRELLQILDENIFSYTDEAEITPDYKWSCQEENMKRISLIFASYFFFSCCISNMACLGGYALTGKLILIYPAKLPWDSMGVNYGLQMWVSVLAAWTLYTRWTFSILISCEFERQCKRMCTALETVERRSRKEAGVYQDGVGYRSAKWDVSQIRYYGTLRGNIVQCIRHHQAFIRALTFFKRWFVIVYSIQLAGYTMEITLCMYFLIEDVDYLYKITLVIIILIALVESFIWNFVGNKFSEMHLQMKDCIYFNIEWYNFPMEIRKLLITFHLLIQCHPFNFYGFSIFEAGYERFWRTLHVSYSYFNILRSVM